VFPCGFWARVQSENCWFRGFNPCVTPVLFPNRICAPRSLDIKKHWQEVWIFLMGGITLSAHSIYYNTKVHQSASAAIAFIQLYTFCRNLSMNRKKTARHPPIACCKKDDVPGPIYAHGSYSAPLSPSLFKIIDGQHGAHNPAPGALQQQQRPHPNFIQILLPSSINLFLEAKYRV